MTQANKAPQVPMVPLAAIPGGPSPLNPEMMAGMYADTIGRLMFFEPPAVLFSAPTIHMVRAAMGISNGDRVKALAVVEEIKSGIDKTFAAMFPLPPANTNGASAPSGNRTERRASKKGK